MANITDKTVKSKYPPKDTNVTWIDTSVKPAVTKSYINGTWIVVGGGGGTKKYSDLEDKPTINGVELDGNKTSSDLGMATSQQGAKADSAYQKPSSGIPQSDLSSDVQSQLNKYFKGWYNTLAELKAEHIATNGDSAYVKDASPATTWSIYVYDSTASSDNYWADSGTDADTSDVQTFASGEEVNEISIDNDFVGGSDKIAGAEETKTLNDFNFNNIGSVVNILNPSDIQDGLALSYINVGATVTTYSASNYKVVLGIPVKQGVSYIIGKRYRQYVIYGNDNKIVQGSNTETSTPTQITSPINGFLAVTFSKIFTPNESDCYINNDIRFTEYVPYNTLMAKLWLINSIKQYQDREISDNSVTTQKIIDGAISTSKIADGAVTSDKISTQFKQTIIHSDRTYNLYDDATMFVDGIAMDSGGTFSIVTYAGITDFIPIIGGHTYYFSAKSWARTTGFAWYKEDKSLVGEIIDTTTVMQGMHTAPLNAAYLIVTLKWNNVKTVDFMLAESSVLLDYKPYRQIETTQINGFEDAIESVADEKVDEKISDLFTYNLRLVKKSENSSDMYYVYEGNDYIKGQYPYTPQNNNFNFLSIYKNSKGYDASDDIPAMRILNTTIGGNHGQPIRKLTITNHGFTNADIGTGWVYSGSGTANGKTFYIVKIYDADNIGVQSQNDGTNAAPVWTYITETGGILTRNGANKTVEASVSTQLWPSETNITLKFFVDNEEVPIISGDYNQNYYGDVIDIVETYEVKNPVSVLNNLIANVGNTNPPTYEGDSAIKVEHTFRFVKGLNVIFLTNYIPLQEIRFGDFLFAMKKRLNSTLTGNKYYIPNSLPLSIDGGSTYTFDCRTPTNFPSGVSNSIWVDSSRKANQEYPINRILEIDTQNNFGVAMGVFTELGIGRKLDNYTNSYFELRYDTGAIYPSLLNSQIIGTTLQPGQIYSGVMYWGFFNANLSDSNNRMSMYHFNLDNAEYVYVDYKGSTLDKIEIDNSLNGKKIEVIENSNATLVNMDGNVSTDDVVNDMYNGGFYVDANYVTGETCYIVLKIG